MLFAAYAEEVKLEGLEGTLGIRNACKKQAATTATPMCKCSATLLAAQETNRTCPLRLEVREPHSSWFDLDPEFRCREPGP